MNGFNNCQKAREELIFVDVSKDGSIEDLIKPNPENRVSEKNRPHINRLKKSLLDRGYDRENPIIVDKNLIQQTGHHRRKAILEIESMEERGEYKGFWVKVSHSAVSIHERAHQEDIVKRWSVADWILAYARKGIGEYPMISAFIDRYGFKMKVNQMLLADLGHQPSSEIIDKFRMGEFEVKDWNVAHMKAQYLLEIEKIIDAHLTVVCAAAILGFFKVDGFRPERLLNILKEHRADFVQQRTEENNRKLLEDYYNCRLRANNRLKITLK